MSVIINLSAQITVYKYGNADKMFMTYIVNGDKVICYDTLLIIDSMRLYDNNKIPLRKHYMVTCYDYKSKMECDWIKYKDNGEISRFGSWHTMKNNSKTDFLLLPEQVCIKPVYKKLKGTKRIGEYNCKIMEKTLGDEKYLIYYVDKPNLSKMLAYKFFKYNGLIVQITKGDKVIEQLQSVESLNDSNTILSQKEIAEIFNNWKK